MSIKKSEGSINEGKHLLTTMDVSFKVVIAAIVILMYNLAALVRVRDYSGVYGPDWCVVLLTPTLIILICIDTAITFIAYFNGNCCYFSWSGQSIGARCWHDKRWR